MDEPVDPQNPELFRLAVDLSPSGMIVVDDAGAILLVNREIERMFGYGHGELVGQQVEILLPGRLRGNHPDFRGRYYQDPKPRRMGVGRDLFGRRKDGTEVPVEIGLNPVKTEHGLVVLASVVDISSRKRDEERFQAAVEASPSGMVLTDRDGTIVLVNREVERLFGYTREELVGRPVEMLVPSATRASHTGLRNQFFEDPQSRAMGAGRKLFGVHREGREIPVQIGLNPIRIEQDIYVLSSIVDISARQQAEAALHESRERFKLLVESVQDYAIVMLDQAGIVRSWNSGAQSIEGYSENEIVGQDYKVFFTEEDRAAGRPDEVLSRTAADGRFEEEAWRMRKDGSRYFSNVVMTALRGPDGQLLGFANVSRDITERRSMEERLRHSQKMEAIGTLAGGIAHDFNNILLSIVGYSELAHTLASGNRQLIADIDQVTQAAERGRQLVQRILAFSRRHEITRVPTRLELPAREAIQLLRASLPTTIEMRETFDPNTPNVLSDETSIHQILMNLATNALQAMPDGGVLEIRLAPYTVGPHASIPRVGLKAGEYARLTVSDTGSGMPPEVQERAFEPFFTTKPQGSGTGLGLAVIHGIVESHGGAIELWSQIGKGTRFDIFLPAMETGATLADDTEVEAAPPAKRHVMVVEDEQGLAMMQKRRLESFGYRVTVHTSSVEALEDFRARSGEFDLLITDNTMPKLTGLALAQEVRRIHPELPVLMISGLADIIDPSTLEEKGITRLLHKPHTGPELAQTLHEIFEKA
jgi:PAS domain S-box-containing protein